MIDPKPLPPGSRPSLEQEYREWERWLDGYIEHWGNEVGKFLEAKGHRKVKSARRAPLK